MIRRPLNERFVTAVQTGIKVTTIRDKPWPVGKPIMLYRWLGKPYASKQEEICDIIVHEVRPVKIAQGADGKLFFDYPPGPVTERNLYEAEGFASREELESWFRPLVPPGKIIEKHLMIFRKAPANQQN